FINRDPIGIWGDLLNLGNGQTYTGGNPWKWMDPWGLCPELVPDSDVAQSNANLLNDIVNFGGSVLDAAIDAGEGIVDLGIGVAEAAQYPLMDLTYGLPQTSLGLAHTGLNLTAGNLYQLLAGGELTRIDASDYFMGGPIE